MSQVDNVIFGHLPVTPDGFMMRSRAERHKRLYQASSFAGSDSGEAVGCTRYWHASQRLT